MRRGLLVLTAIVLLPAFSSVARADEFTIDSVHSGVTFHVSHLDLTYVYGRFNSFSGDFKIDGGNSAFNMTIKVDSVDTGNKQRDGHLTGGDFFNAKQFSQMTFKSTAVKPVEGGYEVTGDFTMHGVTQPITFTLKGGKEAEFPKGVKRTGFSTQFTLKRSAYGMDKMVPMIGDEVYVAIGFEGAGKK